MASLGTTPRAALRVCLLHNYGESQQFSMKTYADRLGKALASRDVSVERIQPRDVLPPSWRASWLGHRVDSYLGRFVHYPHIASGSRATKAADVYHIIDHGQAHLLAWLDPRRVVVTCHDLMLLVLESGRLGRRGHSLVALQLFRAISTFLRRAAMVVADSEQTRRDLIKFVDVDPARLAVISPGMNQPFSPDPALRDAGRRRWALEGKMVVLQVGTAFYKNVEATLRMVARLHELGLPVTLLRGGGHLLPGQALLAEQLGLRQSICEAGVLADDELPMLYNSADVLLCPSLYEGFGWPPLEAMACGTPVVCARAGSLTEVVGTAALTADPEDIDHLTEHVAALLTDPALAGRMRDLGRRRAAEFDWDITAKKFVDVYERVRERA